MTLTQKTIPTPPEIKKERTMTTPPTPAFYRAEQERWQKLLKKYEISLAEYEKGDEAYWREDAVPPKPYPRQLEAERRRLERLREEIDDSLTPTLAQAYADLNGQMAAMMEALEGLAAEVDTLAQLETQDAERAGKQHQYALEKVCEGMRVAYIEVAHKIRNILNSVEISRITPETTGWIPVSQRLPEEGQRVLFVTIGGAVLSGKYYRDGWDEPIDFWGHEEVTHWQPLPAPPAQASAGGE